jgi:hypothetical protein
MLGRKMNRGGECKRRRRGRVLGRGEEQKRRRV